MENQSFVDKLAWIHIVDRRILCNRSKTKTVYYLPGGKREPGESDEQALTREIREELTVDLVPATLRFAGEFEAQADGKPAGIPVHMRCYTAEYRGRLAPAAEIAEMVWFTYADRERVSDVARLIFDWLLEGGMIALD